MIHVWHSSFCIIQHWYRACPLSWKVLLAVELSKDQMLISIWCFYWFVSKYFIFCLSELLSFYGLHQAIFISYVTWDRFLCWNNYFKMEGLLKCVHWCDCPFAYDWGFLRYHRNLPVPLISRRKILTVKKNMSLHSEIVFKSKWKANLDRFSWTAPHDPWGCRVGHD